jgi:HAD superfamily hydrolase (TIGR01509 family)
MAPTWSRAKATGSVSETIFQSANRSALRPHLCVVPKHRPLRADRCYRHPLLERIGPSDSRGMRYPGNLSAMTLPRKGHAVVFDVDGLILDNEFIYRDAMIAAAVDGGHDLTLGLYLTTVGLSTEATRTVLSDHFGKAFDFGGFWTAASRRFHEMAASQLRLKAGVIELLNVLDDIGLPRAVATSSCREDVQRYLTAYGLLDRFQAVVAQGDYVRGKPNPDPFLKAAERLGAEPACCIALEDSYNGVRAASSAGMMTIMVPDLLPPTPEMERLCICIVRDLHQVCTLMKP